ncbi:MAG: hypothetical protein M3512_06800 [Bacteroidota bacterium]|nr:hypothetical protein [Bacteroidota bacterium]
MREIFLLISGIIATAIMTLLMYMIGFFTGKRIALFHFLGTMAYPGKTSNSFLKNAFAIILHFLVGILYAFVYSWLWSIGIGKPNFFWSIIFGIASGIIAIMGWGILISKSKNPPAIALKVFFTGLFFTHIVFSIIVFFTYLFLERYPLPLVQSLNCG